MIGYWVLSMDGIPGTLVGPKEKTHLSRWSDMKAYLFENEL